MLQRIAKTTALDDARSSVLIAAPQGAKCVREPFLQRAGSLGPHLMSSVLEIMPVHAQVDDIGREEKKKKTGNDKSAFPPLVNKAVTYPIKIKWILFVCFGPLIHQVERKLLNLKVMFPKNFTSSTW